MDESADIYKNYLFHFSDGHNRPAVVTAAMLQYYRFLESMQTYSKCPRGGRDIKHSP